MIAVAGVSVPFTSGSSLQRIVQNKVGGESGEGFSSLYIGILAATAIINKIKPGSSLFQFPLHRDPRCNLAIRTVFLTASTFQFPLHRDPRCNSCNLPNHLPSPCVSVPFTSGSSLQREIFIPLIPLLVCFSSLYIGILAATSGQRDGGSRQKVSVPFTSGSSLQPKPWRATVLHPGFQFPLHRDPRCNADVWGHGYTSTRVSVPFTSGSSLQQGHPEKVQEKEKGFSSLYIGILAATSLLLHLP